MNSDFDPVRFGRLESTVDDVKKDVHDLKNDVRSLLGIANQAKGARWLFGGAFGVFGAMAGWVISHIPLFTKGP